MKKINGIESSTDSSVIQSICRDERIDSLWENALFLNVVFSAKEKGLRFLNFRDMWKCGLTVKRYVEYPDITSCSIHYVFDELYHYLQRGDYVLHCVGDDLDSDNRNRIVAVFPLEQTVTVQTWENDRMYEETMAYEEYYESYVFRRSPREVMRFDMYRPVGRMGSHTHAVEEMKKRLKRGRISALNRVRCLSSKSSIPHSVNVLKEWFSVFEDTLLLCRMPMPLKEEEQRLFQTGMSGNMRKHLNQMISIHNRCLQSLGKKKLPKTEGKHGRIQKAYTGRRGIGQS